MPPRTKTQKSIIRANLPQILAWVDEGFTLKSIHQSLQEDGILTCGYSNFARCYDELKGKTLSSPEAGQSHVRSHPMQATDSTTPTNIEPESIEEETAPAKKRRAIIEGFDVEKQKRIAAYAFEQARKGH